jgi:hypothetical protein
VNDCQHLVTVNLESALRRLRQNDSDLTLWVDALSINQSDNSERTEQVKLMHLIFGQSEETIVYLGEVANHGSMGSIALVSKTIATFYCDDRDEDKLEVFRSHCVSMKSKARIDYSFEMFCFLRLLGREPDLNNFPSFDSVSGEFIDTKYQRNLFEALRQMMLCRWWNRIWVIQEVVVPKKITMVYGATVAPWSMFVTAAQWESRNRSSLTPISFPQEYKTVLTYFSRIILDIERLRELWRDGQETALLQLLRRFSGRKASDGRDKVYALLSLARSQTSIVPNYSHNVPRVFQSTVLDIIQTMGSLDVLAGDLGRKDRQDLPSWVPDWSATYDDLDRRRSEDTRSYNATDDSVIYVQDIRDTELSGIRHFLGTIGENAEGDQVTRFNGILGTSDWTKWLPDDDHGSPNEPTCLTAIENFYTARGSAACLQNLEDGVIKVAGLHIDKISSIAHTAFSEEDVLSVVRSWALLICKRFAFAGEQSYRTGGTLGDTFRKVICADLVGSNHSIPSTTRRLDDDDHDMIAAWILQGLDPQTSVLRTAEQTAQACWEMCEDLGNPESLSKRKGTISPAIDAAIRSATVRRTLFITDKGYIGLGPAKMRENDHLYILLGSRTPFILRNAGSRRILRRPGRLRLGGPERKCLEVVGDCYAPGLMDGEAMTEWKNVNSNTKEDAMLQTLLKKWQEYFETWERHNHNLTLWKFEINRDVLPTRLRGKDYDVSRLWDRMNSLDDYGEVSGKRPYYMTGLRAYNYEYDEAQRARSYTDHLANWQNQFIPARSIDWTARLLLAAEWKVKNIETDIADAERLMDAIEEEIKEKEKDVEQNGHVYLI